MPTQECVLWIMYLSYEEKCLYAQSDTIRLSQMNLLKM